MGIENREYYREERPAYAWEDHGRGRSWSAVTWMLLITVATFVAQLVLGPRFTELLMLQPQLVQQGQIWRLLTYAFLHHPGDPWHILLNMWVLHMSGRDFEARRGSAEFVAFYLMAAVIAGLAVLGWEAVSGRGAAALGASGATSAVLMVYAFTYPRSQILMFGFLPMPMLTFAGLIILLDSLPLLRELTGGRPDGIAHTAHLGGFAFGILYQRFNWRVLNWLPFSGRISWGKLVRRQPALKVHRPPPSVTELPDFEQRVDDLLDKVARSGEASLTDEERQILVEASRRARNRLSH